MPIIAVRLAIFISDILLLNELNAEESKKYAALYDYSAFESCAQNQRRSKTNTTTIDLLTKYDENTKKECHREIRHFVLGFNARAPINYLPSIVHE